MEASVPSNKPNLARMVLGHKGLKGIVTFNCKRPTHKNIRYNKLPVATQKIPSIIHILTMLQSELQSNCKVCNDIIAVRFPVPTLVQLCHPFERFFLDQIHVSWIFCIFCIDIVHVAEPSIWASQVSISTVYAFQSKANKANCQF